MFCSGDDDLVIRGTPAWGTEAVARMLSMSEAAVKRRARELGATQREWTDDERAALLDLWPGRRVTQIAGMLMRSPEEVAAEADRLGLMAEEAHNHYARWTAEEMDFVRTHYHRLGADAVGKLLDRPADGVIRIARDLGIQTPKSPDWQPTEDDYLWKARETGAAWAEIGKALGRSYEAVRARHKLLSAKRSACAGCDG